MAESVYKIIELVGTSTESWEDAAKNAVETAAKSLDEIRIAEVVKLDMKVEDEVVVAEHAAFGATGCARGVDERGEVFLFDGLPAAVHFGLVDGGADPNHATQPFQYIDKAIQTLKARK